MYQRSGTAMTPVLLHDEKSIIPKKWPYEIAKLESSEPDNKVSILDRVNYLKSQLYSQLGKCLVVDWDCFFLDNLDHLDDLDVKMAMPENRNGTGFGTGLILMNSPEIVPQFHKMWTT